MRIGNNIIYRFKNMLYFVIYNDINVNKRFLLLKVALIAIYTPRHVLLLAINGVKHVYFDSKNSTLNFVLLIIYLKDSKQRHEIERGICVC